MKKLFFSALAGLALSCASLTMQAQEFKQHISKEFIPKKNAAATILAIYNFDGFVKVEGYAGDKVTMEIDEVISAKNERTLEIGKDEFKLEFDQQDDTIMAYLSGPFDSRPNRERHRWNDQRKIEYKFKLQFTVKVPYSMNLDVSTVTEGDVTVKDVAGELRVNNVNGAVSIVNAKNTTYAHTINGNVDANYIKNPSGPSSYYTINGQINVTYPTNLSADLQFKSMNGQFYTDFDDAQMLPVSATKTKEDNDGVITYRLNKNTVVRIGNGGATFKFETLNGNIYIKKQS